MLFRKSINRTVTLALQGGGAHGAFTWGVLDRLLEEGRLDFEGVSGTSAGAMNAVALADGWAKGGRDGARQSLADFWTAVGSSVPFETAIMEGDAVRLSPAFKLLLRWSHSFSPEQLNPYDINPLREILAAQIDFERLRAQPGMQLFIAATHANSGKLKVFKRTELTAEMVLASACLPNLHRTIEIDGEPYWDGGYSANPAVFPLLENCSSRDLLMVLLAPLQRKITPNRADEIKNRILDISFNATFLREMRSYARIREATRQSWLPFGRHERRIAEAHFHVIHSQNLMDDLGTESKLAAHQEFFDMLRDQGRQAASDWLAAHFKGLGQHSTADLATLFAA